MLGKRRLARLLGLSAALLLATSSCQSDAGGSPTDRTTDECADACAKIAAADCGDVGSECVDRCVRGPVPSAPASAAGDCDSVESAYINCFWGAAAYVCDETLGTLPVGCDDERGAVKKCESSAGAGGAASDEAGAGGATTAAGGAGGAP